MVGQSGPSVAAITLRTRAVYFLPLGYEFIEIEIRVADAAWVTDKVPVEKNGTALVDFWARIPTSEGSNKTHISLKVCTPHAVCMDISSTIVWLCVMDRCDACMHAWQHGYSSGPARDAMDLSRAID